MIMKAGKTVEFLTRDRMIGSWIGATNYPPMLHEIYKNCKRLTTDTQLIGISRNGGRLEAHLWNEYSEESSSRIVDQIVVEYGTLPNDDIFFDLKTASKNHGQIDFKELTDLKVQTLNPNPKGNFKLFRIGDAVASRNIHASLYDARRLCQAF